MAAGKVSGCDLNERLVALAWKLSASLRASRQLGGVTPENPITGKQIVADYRAGHADPLSEEALRAMINYLRRRGVPIASSGAGYFYALTELELEPTRQHLRDRIAGMSAALAGLERPTFAGDA